VWIVWALIGPSRGQVKKFRNISAHHMAGGWLLLHVVLITIQLNFHVLDGHKKVPSFPHVCITITHTPDIMGRCVTWNDYATPRLEKLINAKEIVRLRVLLCRASFLDLTHSPFAINPMWVCIFPNFRPL
jgi:hypothetical protein